MKKKGITFRGRKFFYDGSIDSSVTVYPTDRNGRRRGSEVHIDKKIIALVKTAVRGRSRIQMGACYDNPSTGSLGELLYREKISPLLLSYILPLLENVGFLTHYKEGRAYWVTKNKASKTGARTTTSLMFSKVTVPDREEFQKGCKAFEKETRDAIYRVATFLMHERWGRESDMADALGVLLLTWNQAFYRYGSFDYDVLERCITKNLHELKGFRKRNIFTLSGKDEKKIKSLFDAFLTSLQIATGKSKGRKSPVAVAKALHLLAPAFFPLWDKEIAWAYGCYYNEKPAMTYVAFSKITKAVAEEVAAYAPTSNKTLLKLIDEYNYSKFTKEWI